MQATKADKLTDIALSIFRLNGQLIEWGDHFARAHRLTSARWQMLGAISMASDPPSIPQIAAAMGVTRQGALKQVTLLVEEGLVQPRPNPAHKRSPVHVLTARGQSAYAALTERWREHVTQLACGFGASDLDAALRVLAALSTAHAVGPST